MKTALFLLAFLVQDVDTWIQDLGSESYEKREKAMAEIRKIGKPALEALKKATQSEDPEVRVRAKQLIAEIDPPERKPPLRTGGGRISVQSANGNTTYVITPNEGEPISFKRWKDGTVELEYPEDGKKQTAKSESLEKFLAEHADLAKRYGISRNGIDYGGLRASFSGRRTEFRVMPQDDPEQFFREFEEQMEKLRRRFRDFGFPDEEWTPSWGARESVSGATFDRVDEALRSHLEIPAGSGLLVRGVQSRSLLAEFDLRKHDILLEIDGAKVSSGKDVRTLLKKESKLLVIRGGKRLELKRTD